MVLQAYSFGIGVVGGVWCICRDLQGFPMGVFDLVCTAAVRCCGLCCCCLDCQGSPFVVLQHSLLRAVCWGKPQALPTMKGQAVDMVVHVP